MTGDIPVPLPGFEIPDGPNEVRLAAEAVSLSDQYATELWPTVIDIRRGRKQYDGAPESEKKNHKQDASSKESEFAAAELLRREGRTLSDPDVKIYTGGKTFGPDLMALDGGQNIHVKELSDYWDKGRGPSIVVQDRDKYLHSGSDPDLLVIMHKKRGAWHMEAVLPAAEVPKYLSPMAIGKYNDGPSTKSALYINDLPLEYRR